MIEKLDDIHETSHYKLVRKINEIIDSVNALAEPQPEAKEPEPSDKVDDMTPMESWNIISRNLVNYYAMRSGPGFKGYTDKDTEAEVIAFMALKKMEKEDNG